MEKRHSNIISFNSSQEQGECQSVSLILSVQSYAQSGDYEGLEKALSTRTFAKGTLNSCLIAAIRQARISTDHLMCVKLLSSKGADLNLVQEGNMFSLLRWFHSSHASCTEGQFRNGPMDP